jgi:hypothetical protein
MKVLNLRCAHGHGFEGWFGSERDVAEQMERGLVECPLCGDARIERMPTAPRLSLSSSRVSGSVKARKSDEAQRAAERESTAEAAPAEPGRTEVVLPAQPHQPSIEAMWMHAVRQVIANTEDVGTRFADEARRIHYGEVPERGIRGQASADETEALRDEGIEVHALPVPKALKGPAH